MTFANIEIYKYQGFFLFMYIQKYFVNFNDLVQEIQVYMHSPIAKKRKKLQYKKRINNNI